MLNRPFATSLMTFGIGFTVSVVLLLLSDPLCDAVQQKRLMDAAQTQSDVVVSELNQRFARIQSFADALIRDESLDVELFTKQAQSVTSLDGVYSVEWHPRVDPSERSQMESNIQQDYGLDHPIDVITYEEGRTVTFPSDSVFHPVRFVFPVDDVTKRRIGFHRVWSETRNRATKTRQFAITERSRFFGGDRMRYGAWFVAGSTLAAEVPTAMVFVTLDQLFSAEALEGDVLLDVKDVSHIRPSKKTASADYAKNTLHTLSVSHHSYVGWRRIGGRSFRFVARESATAGFRPNWIPWFAFSICNAIAIFLSMLVYQREAISLRLSNQDLQDQVERRKVTERQLQKTIDFREQERELLAHEIHDTFVQDMIGAQMFAESTLASLPAENAERERVSLVSQLLSQAIDEARRTIDFLKPRVVDEVGLVTAIESSVVDDLNTYGFDTGFDSPDDFPRLPLLVERMLYRIVREGLANVRQHSGVKQAQLRMSFYDQKVQVEVTDEGKGFEVDAIDGDRFGIQGIRHRVALLKGQLTIESSKRGTRLHVEVPADIMIPDSSHTDLYTLADSMPLGQSTVHN